MLVGTLEDLQANPARNLVRIARPRQSGIGANPSTMPLQAPLTDPQA
jgi:hypothetical protein